MHDDRSIIEGRLRRLAFERLNPAIHDGARVRSPSPPGSSARKYAAAGRPALMEDRPLPSSRRGWLREAPYETGAAHSRPGRRTDAGSPRVARRGSRGCPAPSPHGPRRRQWYAGSRRRAPDRPAGRSRLDRRAAPWGRPAGARVGQVAWTRRVQGRNRAGRASGAAPFLDGSAVIGSGLGKRRSLVRGRPHRRRAGPKQGPAPRQAVAIASRYLQAPARAETSPTYEKGLVIPSAKAERYR